MPREGRAEPWARSVIIVPPRHRTSCRTFLTAGCLAPAYPFRHTMDFVLLGSMSEFLGWLGDLAVVLILTGIVVWIWYESGGGIGL